jgi:hypothetical protein
VHAAARITNFSPENTGNPPPSTRATTRTTNFSSGNKG